MEQRPDLTEARRLTIADSYSRFRRMRGDTVLASLGFERDQPGVEQGSEQLRQRGFAFDWSRALARTDPAAERWAQRMFLHLHEAGLVHRSEGPTDWCERCRTLLPAATDEAEGCRQCGQPLTRIAAGQWHLQLDSYAAEDAQLGASGSGNGAIQAAHDHLLGRVEGVELEAHATDGTPLVVFTTPSGAVEDAKFVALSPDHPALERWMQEPEAQQRLAQLRAGHGDGNGLEYASLMNTGVWVQVPGIDDLLPLIVSLAVDARYGATAALGIPTSNPVDERLAERLPPPPTLHLRSQAKQSKPREATRLRGRYLPISNGDRSGAGIPVVHCTDCGRAPLPSERLPVPAGDEQVCPTCGKPAQPDQATLDPAVVGWAEMLVGVPPEERMEANFENPELRRWLAITTTLHDSGNPAALLCDLVLMKALRDQGLVDFLPAEAARDRDLLTGTIGIAGSTAGEDDSRERVEEVGADAVRFALLYAAAPSKGLGVGEFEPVLRLSQDFLARLRAFAEPRLRVEGAAADDAIDTSARLRRRLAAWCDVALGKVAENFERLQPHRATRNAMLLLARIEDFDQRSRGEGGEQSPEDAQAVRAALGVLLALLAPVAPQTCAELRGDGGEEPAAEFPWPAAAPRRDATGAPA